MADERNSERVRLLLLAEIVARTTKNVMRSYLRMILKIMKTSTEYVQVSQDQQQSTCPADRYPIPLHRLFPLLLLTAYACVCVLHVVCVQVALIVEFLNVLTGSHPNSAQYYAEQLYHAAVCRYGHLAISFNERPNLRSIISPAVIYVVQRLQVRFLPVP